MIGENLTKVDEHVVNKKQDISLNLSLCLII